MQRQISTEKKFDQYLDHLEFLSSKIADNISMGLFKDINKMDYERKAIIKKISSDAANLNNNNKNRLRLVWVNNQELIKKTEILMCNRQESFNKTRKTLKAYSKNN